MPSAKVLAMRVADAARVAPPEHRVCARADCETGAGVRYVDERTKRMFRVKNSNLVKEGDLYVHADRAICDALAARRDAARRRASVEDLSAHRPGDVLEVRDGDAPTPG